MPAGSAGLAAHLPAALGYDAPAQNSWPACTRPLAIVGTPAATAQANVAKGNGKQVLFLAARERPPDLDRYDGLLLTGGETAARVLRHLGVESLDLRGEAFTRVPVGLCIGGTRPDLPIALKSGGFGPPNAIDAALERLASGG